MPVMASTTVSGEPNVARPADNVITGRVVDNLGEPLIGVTVMEVGTQNATVTDFEGNYSLSVKAGAKLQFSYIGFVAQEVAARNGQTITLAPENNDLDEIVVVGYGVQKKANLTGAVASVDFAKEALSRPVTSAGQALAGMAAGVQVMQSSGRPNSEGIDIKVRGVGTLNDASPLVLVDGMEMSLNDVNPNDIESISILKDAASCAIYGNRGANGVILVTTKQGQEGQTRVTYSGKLSINTPSKLVKFMSNYGDYMELVNIAGDNFGSGHTYSDATIEKWRAAEKDPNGFLAPGQKYPNYVAYPNTDWYDEIYQTKVMQEHSLSLVGKEKRTNYSVGLTYQNNPGMIVRSGVEKYFINTAVTSNVTDWLEIGSHIWGSHDDQDRNDVGNLTAWEFLKTVPGIYPYYDGKFGGIETSEEDGAAHNPLQNINANGDSYYKHTRALATAHAQIKFLNDFTFKTQIGYEYFHQRHKYVSHNELNYSFSRSTEDNDYIVTPAATLSDVNVYMYHNEFYKWKLTNTLNWNHTFGQHDVSALLGFEEQKYYAHTLDTNKRGILDWSITDMSTVTEMRNISGNDTENRYRSWFGRVNYAFASKYLFEADFRYDGSSKFAPDVRWGFFPSASAGWRVSEEAFAKNSFLSVFDNLKLRASYGVLGNSAVSDYAYQSFYETGYAVMGGVKAPRFYLKQLPNIGVTWETTKTFNVGIDFATLNNRLYGTIDFYNKYTDGILYSPSIGLTYGDKTAPLMNLAEVSNRGLELTIGWNDRVGDFTYGVSVNGTWNRNRVEKYKGTWQYGWDENGAFFSNLGEVSAGGNQRIVEGHQINEWYLTPTYSGTGRGFAADGINGGPKDGMIRTEADMEWVKAMIAEGHEFLPKRNVAKNGIWYGDLIYADVNKDGTYGGSNDQEFQGISRTPKFNFGIQARAAWKGIDVSMNWGGATGFGTYWEEVGQNSSDVVYGLSIPQEIADNYYSADNINAKYPRVVLANETQNTGIQNTFYFQKCDFMKLRNLTVGYTLPKNLTHTIYCQNVRVYFSGENLWTITGFTGLDPEMAAGSGYTTMRQFAFGLNVTF